MGNCHSFRPKELLLTKVGVEAVTATSPKEQKAQFYQKTSITDENINKLASAGGLRDLSWYEFLVHTELCTMNYDCLGMEKDERLLHMVRMMENFKVPVTLRQQPEAIIPFIYDVFLLMRDNSYHNFTHVTDVTQYMYTLLLATHVADKLEPIEVTAAFLGAVCHDLDHPGLSNTFQNNENTPLSQKYHKDSPLENHHLAEFERLAAKHKLFAKLSSSEEQRLRDVVSHMILATDMAKHGMLMAKITECLADESYNPLASSEGVNLMLQIALKCADISNQARPWAVANRWNVAVYAEFYHEGDLDRGSGRKVNALFDRETNNIAQSTVGFIAYLVAPLYQTYVDIMTRCAQLDAQIDSTAVEECLVFLHKNKERYQLLAKGEFVDLDEMEEELFYTFHQPEVRTTVSPSKLLLKQLPGVNGAFQSDERKRLYHRIKMSKVPAETRRPSSA